MLSPIGKGLVAFLVVGFLGGALWFLRTNADTVNKYAPGLIENTAPANELANPVVKRDAADGVIVAGANTWGGNASLAYMNNGSKDASTNSRFFTQFGQKVQIKVIDDFLASREALKSGAIDVLAFCTVGEFSIESGALAADGIKVYLKYDASWGGDALVVAEGINSIADLVGKTIALAPGSPSHGLFVNLIRVSGYNQSQFVIKEVKDGLDAADAFRKEQVAAAFVWSPDDVKLPREVKGAKVLLSTKTAPDIIMDVLLVRESVASSKHEAIKNFIGAWLYGSAQINTSTAARAEAVENMVSVFGLPSEDWSNLTIAKFMTLGDNLNFFGLNPDFRGVTGEELYSRMGDEYAKLRYNDGSQLISGEIPSWRQVADPVFIRELQNHPKLSSPKQVAEAPKVFKAPTEEIVNSQAITTTRVTVEFATGSAELTFDAKRIIKREFGNLARGFSNAYIRVEGNTDNTGSDAINKPLSLKRANAVKKYLMDTYGWPSNKIIPIGNGSDSPVADNDTDEGRAANRNTAFEILK